MAVQLTHIDEWSIDASNQLAPSLWIHTSYAWYRLVRPIAAYKQMFEPLNFKLELYRRIVSILEPSSRSASASKKFEQVRDELVAGGVSEEKLMQEADFILKHLSELHPKLYKEDFIKKLDQRYKKLLSFGWTPEAGAPPLHRLNPPTSSTTTTTTTSTTVPTTTSVAPSTTFPTTTSTATTRVPSTTIATTTTSSATRQVPAVVQPSSSKAKSIPQQTLMTQHLRPIPKPTNPPPSTLAPRTTTTTSTQHHQHRQLNRLRPHRVQVRSANRNPLRKPLQKKQKHHLPLPLKRPRQPHQRQEVNRLYRTWMSLVNLCRQPSKAQIRLRCSVADALTHNTSPTSVNSSLIYKIIQKRSFRNSLNQRRSCCR
eukprot:TRINITY_DN4687_c0_g2_i1.p1 TRINITY_DN4687_c0_g2~~TRINITY_DN4687_c0_g2_i1.p1  ORF type:complete len:431 (-),score=83.17 TRINITY_DN4687_c0_g2_i1:181-1290(-)